MVARDAVSWRQHANQLAPLERNLFCARLLQQREMVRRLVTSSSQVWPDVPLLIDFVAGSRLEREPALLPRASMPVVGNGPPGTFVHFASGRRIPLPTDQIVLAEERDGAARVGLGGMRFDGLHAGQLVFVRVRDLRPAHELSPERRDRMTLEPEMVVTIVESGELIWPTAH